LGGSTPESSASASAPWPKTHSGSGPSRGSPVKNFAAMQPPRQASYEPHDEHAPALVGSRSDTKRSEVRHTRVNPPGSRTLPAKNSSWITNGHAYTSPTGSIRQTTRPAPHRFRPSRGSP